MEKPLRFFTVFVLFALVVINFFIPATNITTDLGRHIKLGEIMWHTGRVVSTNVLSYTYPSFPFVNHHWLSEIIFYLFEHAFGFNSLIVVSTACYLMCFGLAYYFLRRKVSLFSIALGFLLSIGLLTMRTDIRPEIFSMVLLTVFLVVLYTFRRKPSKLIFLLPVLELAWINLHIYFIYGIVLFAVFVVESLILPRLYSSKQRTMLLVAFGATCLATLGNPYGLTGALYPFQIFKNIGLPVAEEESIFVVVIHVLQGYILCTSLALLFVSLFLYRKKTLLVDWLIAIIFTVLAVAIVRNVAVYAIVVLIPFATNVDRLANTLWHFAKARLPHFFSTAAYVWLFSGVILFAFFIPFPAKDIGLGFGIDFLHQPAGMFYVKNNLPERVFNDFNTGNYLEYLLYPKQRVFVDGRPEAFPNTFFQNIYYPAQNDPAVFASVVSKYHITTVFWDIADYAPGSVSFLQHIAGNPEWAMVYLDDQAVIFVRRTNQTALLIQKFGMSEKTVRAVNQGDTFAGLARIAAFFGNIRWDNALAQTFKNMLTQQPHNCAVLRGYIDTLIRLQRMNEALVSNQQYTLFCH